MKRILLALVLVLSLASAALGQPVSSSAHLQATDVDATPTNRFGTISGIFLQAAITTFLGGGTIPIVGVPIYSIAPDPITSFSGTITTSGTNTTVTFSSQVDANNAEYNATHLQLFTKLIAGGQTRYIRSWTTSLICEVTQAFSPGLAGVTPTSVQGLEIFSTDENGVLGFGVGAGGDLYLEGTIDADIPSFGMDPLGEAVALKDCHEHGSCANWTYSKRY